MDSDFSLKGFWTRNFFYEIEWKRQREVYIMKFLKLMEYFYFPIIYYVRKILQSWKNSTLRFRNIYTFWGLLNSFKLFLRWCVCVYVSVCVFVCDWTRLCLNGAFDWAQIWYVYYRSPSDKIYWFWWISDA